MVVGASPSVLVTRGLARDALALVPGAVGVDSDREFLGVALC